MNADFDIDSHIPDETLSRGWYAQEITDCKETREGASMMVRALIIDGETQPNGKDSTGREVTYFLNVDTAKFAEWPRLQNAMRDALKGFFVAAGLPGSSAAGDFVGKRLLAHNNPRTNKKTNELEENWDKFKAYDA